MPKINVADYTTYEDIVELHGDDLDLTWVMALTAPNSPGIVLNIVSDGDDHTIFCLTDSGSVITVSDSVIRLHKDLERRNPWSEPAAPADGHAAPADGHAVPSIVIDQPVMMVGSPTNPRVSWWAAAVEQAEDSTTIAVHTAFVPAVVDYLRALDAASPSFKTTW